MREVLLQYCPEKTLIRKAFVYPVGLEFSGVAFQHGKSRMAGEVAGSPSSHGQDPECEQLVWRMLCTPGGPWPSS